MRTILVVALGLILVGCETFQESTYTNYNTPYGNVVQASGRAASNAALANTSTNCPSCAVSGSRSPQGQSYRDYRGDQDYLGQITESATRTLSSEISYGINSAIRDALR